MTGGKMVKSASEQDDRSPDRQRSDEARKAMARSSAGRGILILKLLMVFGFAGFGMFIMNHWIEAQADQSRRRDQNEIDRQINAGAQQMVDQGRQVFRNDTFGDEAFWTGALKINQAIAGANAGGVGAGVSPRTALAVGLKVDVDALPPQLVQAVKRGEVNLDDPAVTLALLKLNAVVGLKGTFDEAGKLAQVGVSCALCHSTVDNSFAPGIGRRLDGWANRDLDVGTIVSLSPDLSVVNNLLGVDDATTRKVLASWGPGRFDALLFLDGKAFQPDGRSAATLIPPAYGLAGVNLHGWTGFGSVTYWNAFVANLEMHGSGRFFDPRLNDPERFPIAARNGFGDVRGNPDLVSSGLPSLHFYQLAIPAPKPPEGSFDAAAAARGEKVFKTGNGQVSCAVCHVPPTFTEPGFNLHPGEDIGIDNFEADRSPGWSQAGKQLNGYRTSPLKGLWAHQKGGFFHDGRFATLKDVVEHYNTFFNLNLTEQQKNDLVEYLRSL
jgi:mono/diheme cytochrome c family protein